MKVAVVGATGMVGEVLLQVLEARNFPISELIPVASERSAGRKITFRDKEYEIITIEEAVKKVPDIALLSAGGALSTQWAPVFSSKGTYVIDNSSAWRMNPHIKLIIPEINGDTLTLEDKIIANPNCSTTQLTMVMAPLHKAFKIEKLIVSTYQSVTGTGKAAVEQMESEEKGEKANMVYPYPIYRNAIPHCDVFEDNGFTKEEMKLMTEPQKILGDDSIEIVATAVRIPTVGGHSESVTMTFEKEPNISELRRLLHDTPGIKLQDNPLTNTYPMPIYSHNKDEVFVGRIRKSPRNPKEVNMWIVSDNLRKGAATNTVQIAERMATLLSGK
ncbi:MAG TPA: aspartate-semialdehyde dehydrogenase [Flavobacteriaceae bacterium]|nr:aspartate-semialdehyde dehydrogenase [Flavobacteriaceae bacterium]